MSWKHKISSKVKSGVDKTKAYAKKKIHDKKMDIALDVIDETRTRNLGKNKTTDIKNSRTLSSAGELIENYYAKGGGIYSIQPRDAKGEPKIDDKSLAILEQRVTALPQTKSMYVDANGVYTPERKALHKQIINKFKKDAVCITKDKPIAILMGGSPASGKSSFVKKYRPYLLTPNILKVDADEIRAQLPEYKGFNATQTHLETKDIVTTLISDKNIGVPCDFDMVYDGTMNNTKSYEPLIELLKKHNYEVYIIYITNVDKETVWKRAKERYKKSGRFVPKGVIDDFFEKGDDAFQKLKKEVDGYVVVDGGDYDYDIIERGGKELPQEREYKFLGKPMPKSKLNKLNYKYGGVMANEDLLNIKNFEEYVYENEAEIKRNIRTYGLYDVDDIRNPYDLASVLGVDSRIFRDSDVKYYAEYLDDILDEMSDDYDGEMARGGNITSLKDIPNLMNEVKAKRVTYRGASNGTRIKVQGKEYLISSDDFKKLDWDEKNMRWKNNIEFSAPKRKMAQGGSMYADGGKVDEEIKSNVVDILKELHNYSDEIKFKTDWVNGIWNIVYDDPKQITKNCIDKLRSRKFWNTGFDPSIGVFDKTRINISFDKQAQSLLNIENFDKKDWSPKMYADGGMVDLFEDYENIPENVQGVLDAYAEDFEDGNYEGMKNAKEEIEQLGYTFDFYVDGSAYGLRPVGVELNELEGYEEMAKGGLMYEEGGNIEDFADDIAMIRRNVNVDTELWSNLTTAQRATDLEEMEDSLRFAMRKLNVDDPKWFEIKELISKIEDSNSQGEEYKKGGTMKNENNEMLRNQVVEAKHHVAELAKEVNSKTNVEPWVIAKMERATTDLSDVTHYLDGLQKMEHGGGVEKPEWIASYQKGNEVRVIMVKANSREEAIREAEMSRGYHKLNYPFELVNIYLNPNKMAKGGLTGNQSRLDLNKNGRLDSEDFKMLRNNKMATGGKLERNEYGVEKGYLYLSDIANFDRKGSGSLKEVSSTDLDSLPESQQEQVDLYLNGLDFAFETNTNVPKYNPDLRGQGHTTENYLLGIEGNEDEPIIYFFVDTQGYDYPRYITRLKNYIPAPDQMAKGGSMYADGGNIERGAKKRLAEFFRVPLRNLDKFKFDGNDDVKELTKALNSTSEQGTKMYYEMAIKLSKEDEGDYGKYANGGSITSLELKAQELRYKYQREMASQNNSSSASRNYREADKILNQIREIESEIKRLKSTTKYAVGGEVVGRNITFEDWKGDTRKGTVISILDNGDYEVSTDSGMALVTSDEIIKMRKGGYVPKSKKLTPRQQAKLEKVLHEYKMGQLHSGSKTGPIVKSRKQALAIGLAEARSTKMAKGGRLDVGVYRVGKPTKVSPNLYEQKIVEIFDNGDIATASDYGRKLSDFKSQKYPVITKEQLDSQYKMAKGGTVLKKGNRVRIVNTKFNGEEGLIISEDLQNGDYLVQMQDGSIKGFPFENLMLLSREQFAQGGSTNDGKIRFDMYGYIKTSNRVQDGDTIIRVNSYEEAEEKAKQYLNKNNYQLVELYRKDDFVGSVKPSGKFVYSSRYKKEEMAKGGSIEVGDWVKEKKGTARGKVWEVDGFFVKLEDKYGNKDDRKYLTENLTHSAKPRYEQGGSMGWKHKMAQGGNLDKRFTEYDYKKLVNDAPKYEFYSVKNGSYWKIKKDKDDKEVAKWYPSKEILKITNDKDLLNWLERNSY